MCTYLCIYTNATFAENDTLIEMEIIPARRTPPGTVIIILLPKNLSNYEHRIHPTTITESIQLETHVINLHLCESLKVPNKVK